MSEFKNDGVHVNEYVYDFAEDGGATGAFDLSGKAGYAPVPVGAIIKAVRAKVVENVTSDGSATVEWGNGDDADGYSGSAIAVGSLSDNTVRNGWDNDAALLWDGTNYHNLEVNVADADDGKMEMTVNTAALTAGKIIFLVEYYLPTLS